MGWGGAWYVDFVGGGASGSPLSLVLFLVWLAAILAEMERQIHE